MLLERKDFLQELVAKIGEELNGILRANLYELSLKKEELLRLRNKKRELRRALKNCGIGDLQAKIHVKILIKDILTEKLDMTEEKINDIIPFIDENKIICFMEENVFKQGLFHMGKIIHTIKGVKKIKDDFVIIIASVFYREIRKKLEAASLYNFI